MGLKADLEDAIALWKIFSLPGKVLSIAGVITASASVASISDAVFKWKGFILDGISFYNTIITKLTQPLIGYIGISPTKDENHLIAIAIIGAFGVVRLEIRKEKFRSYSVYRKFIEALAFPVIFLSVVLYRIREAGDIDISDNIQFLVAILLLLPIMAFDRKTLFILYSAMFSAVFIVLMLGAINAGITRPYV